MSKSCETCKKADRGCYGGLDPAPSPSCYDEGEVHDWVVSRVGDCPGHDHIPGLPGFGFKIAPAPEKELAFEKVGVLDPLPLCVCGHPCEAHDGDCCLAMERREMFQEWEPEGCDCTGYEPEEEEYDDPDDWEHVVPKTWDSQKKVEPPKAEGPVLPLKR